MMPSRNDSGIDTMPGFESGNSWKSAPWIIDGSPGAPGGFPDTAGEKMISTIALIRPP